MKFTLSWLKQHLKTDQSVEQITQGLTNIGLEVESVVDLGKKLKPFKVVQIKSLAKHPNADRLNLCQVETGNEALQIVCGDQTIYEGMKAVLARPNDYIPGLDLTLKPAKIRGVESQGMMCSAKEMGLGEEHDGVIRVDDECPLGAVYADYMELNDVMFDIAITPNRGDCANILGIARDLAAAGLGELLALPQIQIKGEYNCPLTLEIKDQKACPIFTGRVIKGVKNGPSPQWLQNVMAKCGLKSISKLVDVTNYISHGIGRPLHVFDLAKLKGQNIIIRKAYPQEKIMALDDIEYTLDDKVTVIADNDGAISIAGIMGGKDSGSYDDTVDVFLESALFDTIDIARSGRKLNIISDARYRFERGVDGALVEYGLAIATNMIMELCGGSPSKAVVAGLLDDKKHIIEFAPSLIGKRLGVSLSGQFSPNNMEMILKKLGFGVETGDVWHVTVPTWRHDIAIAEDLVEEIARIIGYDHVAAVPINHNVIQSNEGDDLLNKQVQIATNLLCAQGYNEALTWSFYSPKVSQIMGDTQSNLTIDNPISQDLSVMRTCLPANLLSTVHYNAVRSQPHQSLFEIGATYHQNEAKIEQKHHICGLRSGKNISHKHWLESQRDVDIFDVKADMIALLEELGLQKAKYQIVNGDKVKDRVSIPAYYHPKKVGVVMQGPKNILGYFGQMHPKVLQNMELSDNTVCFELFMDKLPKTLATKRENFKISPYPIVERDFAFVVDQQVCVNELVSAIKKADKNLIQWVRVFDMYVGDKIESNQKSIAFSVGLRSNEKTLEEKEITILSEAIILQVQKQTGGTLRQ